MALTFVQVTDLHVSLGDPSYNDAHGDATFWVDGDGVHDRVVTTPEVLRELFAEIAAAHPAAAFVIATGDLTNTGADREYAAYLAAVAASPLRVVSIPGNHDHMGATHADISPRRYERHLGERWFSWDEGGVHFAAIDWFSWRLRMDHTEQEAWLAADLVAVPADVPIVLFTHDQMPASFYERLPRAPVATFSGHWHTSRVVQVGPTLHVNTSTATFGGLDYAPAQYRVVTVGPGELAVRTVVRGPAHLDGSTARAGTATTDGLRWAVALDGGAQLAAPVIAGDLVIAATKCEDLARGTIAAVERTTGERAWTVALGSAVKGTPLVVGDAVVAAAVTGETVCVDARTGAERWRVEIADPQRLWTYLPPATDGTRVFVGDVSAFVALDLATGAEVWRRTDLGVRENLTSFARPVVVGGNLLVSFAAQLPSVWALDPATGVTVWPVGEVGRCVYYLPGDEFAAALAQTPVGGITADPDGADAYVVRLAARVDRIRSADGIAVWSSPIRGWFNPAAPVVAGDALLVTEGMGQLWCLDRATGDQRWVCAFPEPAPIAMGPYRADGPALLASPVVVAGHALLPTGAGQLVSVEVETGRVTAEVALGIPVSAALAVAGDLVVALGVDGVLRAVDLHQLVP